MDNKHPLVSVFVVTYNAGEYICETLDSIKVQTYDNIELIVSDDHSSDDTVSLVNEWMDKNKERFARTEVITVDHNTGVSANYNRAVRACRGEWVKNVDGDDLLFRECIQDNITYVLKNQEVMLVFSNVEVINGKSIENKNREFFTDEMKLFFDLSVEDQFKYLLQNSILPSQSCFIKRSLLVQFPYNENYRGLEDAPMWITLTKNGYKAYYFDKFTAYYRLDESMTSSRKRYFSSVYIESSFGFFWNEKVKYIKENNLVDAYNSNRRFLLLLEFTESILKNKKNKFNDFIFKIARRIIYKFISFNI